MKKKILILTTKYPKEKNNLWLTNELALEFLKNNYLVQVIALSWHIEGYPNSFEVENGINVLRIKLPKFFYKLGSFIKVFIFQFYLLFYYLKYIRKQKFEILISSTPAFIFLFFPYLLKRKSKILNYMILWDFYPYCLMSTNIIKSKIIEFLMKNLEKISFKVYDIFGCMSNGNIDFFKEKYPKFFKNKIVEILPIWSRESEARALKISEKKEIRGKYNIGENNFLLVYGGAFSEVQELEKILVLAEKLKLNSNIKFIMIGQGNKKEELRNQIKVKNLDNIFIYDYIPREEYEKLLDACDMGIVCLNSNMKVPSFPSKTLDYFKRSLPILAMVDETTDYLKILKNEEMGIGMQGFSEKKIDDLTDELVEMVNNQDIKYKMGINGNLFYKKNLTVENAYNIISKHIKSNNIS